LLSGITLLDFNRQPMESLMSLYHLFEDAHRRVCLARQSGREERTAWHGLQTPSTMKAMIAQGWMQPVHGETPRVLNWYTFTDAGWSEYQRRFANAPDYFDPAFADFTQKA
jgi:hypothetical protein